MVCVACGGLVSAVCWCLGLFVVQCGLVVVGCVVLVVAFCVFCVGWWLL